MKERDIRDYINDLIEACGDILAVCHLMNFARIKKR